MLENPRRDGTVNVRWFADAAVLQTAYATPPFHHATAFTSLHLVLALALGKGIGEYAPIPAWQCALYTAAQLLSGWPDLANHNSLQIPCGGGAVLLHGR